MAPKAKFLALVAVASSCLVLAATVWFYIKRSDDSLVSQDQAVIQLRPVKVVASADDAIFPKQWHSREIRAKARSLAKIEVERTRRILNEALNKYPPGLLDRELKTIYALSGLSFQGVGACGTYSADSVYVVNEGEVNGYDDEWIEATFHHEFSSLLLWQHPEYLPTNEWHAVNSPSFSYRGDGVQAINQHQDRQNVNPALCSIGFWCEYSQSSMEEDFNMVAERLFVGDVLLHTMADTFPQIKQKRDLVVAFYERIDPGFNREFFLSLASDKQKKSSTIHRE